MKGQSFTTVDEREAQIQSLARRIWQEEGQLLGRTDIYLHRAREIVYAGYLHMALGAPILGSLLRRGSATDGCRTRA